MCFSGSFCSRQMDGKLDSFLKERAIAAKMPAKNEKRVCLFVPSNQKSESYKPFKDEEFLQSRE